jgi:phage tail-like protein
VPPRPADFLERFLGNFESVLTPLEDRIAASYLLTTPEATPEEALPWLASWIGMSFDANLSARGRRRMLAAAPKLYRKHGTVAGLELALDIATDGAVTRGAIVVLEDFRLRRTLATILGADLSDDKDPLLPGLVVSGNSIVGDTLTLGDEERKEFLAIFAAELEVSDDEAEQIQRFFDRVAYRATILVHENLPARTLSLIRRIAELETPAHVATRVLKASYPLIVGIAALVRVDTYLAAKPQPLPVELERSSIGAGDYLIYAPSLDPRLSGGKTTLQDSIPLRGPSPMRAPIRRCRLGHRSSWTRARQRRVRAAP